MKKFFNYTSIIVLVTITFIRLPFIWTGCLEIFLYKYIVYMLSSLFGYLTGNYLEKKKFNLNKAIFIIVFPFFSICAVGYITTEYGSNIYSFFSSILFDWSFSVSVFSMEGNITNSSSFKDPSDPRNMRIGSLLSDPYDPEHLTLTAGRSHINLHRFRRLEQEAPESHVELEKIVRYHTEADVRLNQLGR